MWDKCKNWFMDNVNWCEDTYSDGREKPRNKILEWFYERWLFPWKQNDCMCCNTVRGVAYGLILGIIIGRFLL